MPTFYLDYSNVSWENFCESLRLFSGHSAIYLATALILFNFLIILTVRNYGYIASIKKGIKATNRFIDRHLLITDQNANLFYEKCIEKMPIEFRKSWRNFVRSNSKRVSDYFGSELYVRRTVDYRISMAVVFFRLSTILIAIATSVYLFYTMYDSTFIVLSLGAFALLYIVLISIYYIKSYYSELTLNNKVTDFCKQLDKFVRFKESIPKSLHDFIKPTNSEQAQKAVTISNLPVLRP